MEGVEDGLKYRGLRRCQWQYNTCTCQNTTNFRCGYFCSNILQRGLYHCITYHTNYLLMCLHGLVLKIHVQCVTVILSSDFGEQVVNFSRENFYDLCQEWKTRVEVLHMKASRDVMNLHNRLSISKCQVEIYFSRKMKPSRHLVKNQESCRVLKKI